MNFYDCYRDTQTVISTNELQKLSIQTSQISWKCQR